ncbi:MAG TPA: hypothetical protein VL177_03075 [Terriglobales bacterium]|jgi:hypothetical protein|nr:hypothetical protein [Terriglobales bacterium]
MSEAENRNLQKLSRLETNQINALKSTGPRTAQGKRNTRFNAVKHGFFSRQVVLSSKKIGEDPAEFEALLRKLRHHYHPADISEEIQVEIIAVCLWRERRALRCELGEVGHARDMNRRHNLFTAVTTSDSPAKRILQVLRKGDLEMDRDGELSSATKATLSALFHWDELDDAVLEKSGARPDGARQIALLQDLLHQNIQEAIQHFGAFQEESEKNQERQVIERYSIPDDEALNRILKYQALNDRRLQRALIQLERLQRQRKGDYVPPPVKVSVDGPLGAQ